MTFLEGHSQFCVDVDRDFRSTKLYAATILLTAINMEPIRIKCLHSTLALVAGLVYLINSLHSRPDDDTAGRAIQQTIFPLTHNIRHPNLLVLNKDLTRIAAQYPDGFPYALAGSHFITDIWLKPQRERIKFRQSRRIPENVFKRVWGCDFEDIGRIVFQKGAIPRAVRQGYVPQRKGYTKKRRGRANDENIPAQFEQFAETQVPMNINEPAVEDITMVGEILEKIWQQYASDILQKLGNPRNRDLPITSYSHLTQYDRQRLSVDDINTLDLKKLFTQIQWRHASEEDWEYVIKILFPPKGYTPGHSMKHLPTCKYYNNYIALINQVGEKEALDIRIALTAKSRTLAWLPAAISDRCWDYRTTDLSFTPSPHKKGGGPRIYVNPWIGGQPNLTDHAEGRQPNFTDHTEEDRIALREEEEEGSEDEGGN
jgi:hypothetical protein